MPDFSQTSVLQDTQASKNTCDSMFWLRTTPRFRRHKSSKPDVAKFLNDHFILLSTGAK
jgi:hypothetical protein